MLTIGLTDGCHTIPLLALGGQCWSGTPFSRESFSCARSSTGKRPKQRWKRSPGVAIQPDVGSALIRRGHINRRLSAAMRSPGSIASDAAMGKEHWFLRSKDAGSSPVGRVCFIP